MCLQNKQSQGCFLCPRMCGAKRHLGERGRCGADDTLKVSRAAPYFWEEPCICGEKGCGAVFFSGCPLGCVFCQNREISGGESGIAISGERLAEIFLELQEKGVSHLDLVTPSHYTEELVFALERAKNQGFSLPVVYNTGGYENVDTLKRMDGLVDIYMPDFKYSTPRLARKYSHAEDYPRVAKAALAEMVKQTGTFKMDENGLLRSGTLVRLLLLPGCLIDAKLSLNYLYTNYKNRILYSLMRQYTPMPHIGEKYPELARRVTDGEYRSFVGYAETLGIENGYTQEKESAKDSFIPPFDHTGVEKK